MSVAVVNWNQLEYVPERHGVRFGAERALVSQRMGAVLLRYDAVILPTGRADGPYRFHLIDEHVIVVLGGEPHLRLGGAEYRLAAGDIVALPPRSSSAFQLLNRSERPAHILIGRTRSRRDVIGLPDSNKRIYRVRGLGDARDQREPPEIILQGDRLADYWDGEPGEVPLGPAPPAPDQRDPRIAHVSDVEWEAFGRGPFRGERRRLARRVGAERLGYSLYQLQPGQRPFPYHFHHVNEEFFYVRSGCGQVRTPAGLHELTPGDAFGCVPGPGGAHGIENTGDGLLEYFALSTMIEPEVVEYPDSEKAYVMVGSAPGGDPRARSVDLVVRREDAVAYEEGER